ncbi:hypothetical protein BN946_scf184815.g20 [Trametes cinnabarina]|uniref:DUF659 domain-containing protein n=1 Tax=Pycnoporus cinnabarinus TaxID=5643 RepID=A0A060S7L8_PYCCI|nr:hypothetical protein BN946_scf184815.g20 [Trametes cinnabarina]
MPKTSKSRWWAYFHESSEKYKNDATHHKAFCRRCVQYVVREMLAQEIALAQQSATAPEPRSEEALANEVMRTERVPPVCGKIDLLLRHLLHCEHWAEETEFLEEVQGEYRSRHDKAANAAAIRRVAQLAEKENGQQHSRGPLAARSTAITPSQSLSSLSSEPSFSTSTPSTFSPASPDPILLQAASGAENAVPIDPVLLQSELQKVAHSAGSTSRILPATVPASHPIYAEVHTPGKRWTEKTQADFTADLCRLFIACNIAWSAIEDPVLRLFFARWVPEARLPSRKVLSERVLDEEARRVTEEMRAEVRAKYATGQCDGWKNVNRDSIVASTINAQYTPWLLNLFDVSAVAKTAQNLFQLIVEEVQYCIEHLSVTLVAYCTDAAGDTKAMRDRLCQRFPWLITIDCWAHQINLLVVDYFKHMRHYSTFMDEAEELIKWFNNHTRALAMLKEEQRRIYQGRALSLLYPVTTRWSSRYIACKRLLEVKKAIQWLLLTKLDELVNLTPRGRNAEETSRKQAKARELFLKVRSAEFWDTISILCTQLEPFAVAINIAQADNARLDTVLLALGRLVQTFSNRATISENDGKNILGFIERRWEKIAHDREIFILALLLNPYIRRDCFNRNNPALTEASLWSMFKRLFRQVMQQDADVEVMQAFSDYLSRVGRWSDESMSLKDWKTRAQARRVDVDIVRIWRSFETVNPRGGEAFASFAARLLSIVPNTGATERDFSKMGTIHTKTRNRLKAERVRKTVLIRNYLARSHPLPPRRPGNSSTTDSETSDDESGSVTDNRETYAFGEASSRASSQAAAHSRANNIPPFSAFLSEAIETLLPGEPTIPLIASAAPVDMHNGLLLQNLFDYSSDAFTRIAMQVWSHGAHSLDRDVALHETHVSNNLPSPPESSEAPAAPPSQSPESEFRPAE